MIRNREEAAKLAESIVHNIPNGCQAWVRGLYLAPSVGDVDGDGSSDAEDGWKSEPFDHRHGDRNPPRGVPVAYLGGSKDNGHRAVSLGNGMIRTTDGNGLGNVATRRLDWPETEWGLVYVGWSNTISGQLIPMPPPLPTDKPKQTWVNKARQDLKQGRDRALKNGKLKRAATIQHALDILPKK